MRLATVLGAAFLATALATAAFAAPCKTPRELKLRWEGGKAQINFIAYGCALPPSCPVTPGTTAIKLPLQVTVKAGDTSIFQSALSACTDANCIARNANGCNGGGDRFRSSEGMAKITYLAKGSTSAMVRARGSMTRPAETSGPVTVELTDAGGFKAEATFSKCRSAGRGSNMTIVCH